MTNQPAEHDAIYKRFFSEPEMVRSLIEDFLPPALAAELDFSTLERLPAEHVSETLQKRAGDCSRHAGTFPGAGIHPPAAAVCGLAEVGGSAAQRRGAKP